MADFDYHKLYRAGSQAAAWYAARPECYTLFCDRLVVVCCDVEAY